MKKIFVPVLILIMAAGLQAEEKKKNTQEYVADLKSDNDADVIKAAKGLGEAKAAKEATDAMIAAMKSHQNPKVRIALADGLGMMGTKGQPTTALSEVVQSDDDNAVVYSALLAILNLADFENPAAEKALKFCEDNKSKDAFIADVVKRIHTAMGKNKK
ncbi:MAG: HEAT repeat domain-containing protein [Spirochaetia bacterium]|nr:HEAT repeat domain-containing protein [Spirochaetia bacterium]